MAFGALIKQASKAVARSVGKNPKLYAAGTLGIAGIAAHANMQDEGLTGTSFIAGAALASLSSSRMRGLYKLPFRAIGKDGKAFSPLGRGIKGAAAIAGGLAESVGMPSAKELSAKAVGATWAFGETQFKKAKMGTVVGALGGAFIGGPAGAAGGAVLGNAMWRMPWAGKIGTAAALGIGVGAYSQYQEDIQHRGYQMRMDPMMYSTGRHRNNLSANGNVALGLYNMRHGY